MLGVAGPHVLATSVLLAGCVYLGFGVLKLKVRGVKGLLVTAFTLCFLTYLAFMVHELFFNPVVDLWNLFTDPGILKIGYLQGSYPLALFLMAVSSVGVWWYFFQGEFSFRKPGIWWVPVVVWVALWWMIGFHTSLPFWFQPSMDWPWLHDLPAHVSEFIYTTTFMLGFIRCWKRADVSVVRGWTPAKLRQIVA